MRILRISISALSAVSTLVLMGLSVARAQSSAMPTGSIAASKAPAESSQTSPSFVDSRPLPMGNRVSVGATTAQPRTEVVTVPSPSPSPTAQLPPETATPTPVVTLTTKDAAPGASPTMQPPPSPQRAATASHYLARGRQLLQTGDISAARTYFERALNGGNGEAAVELGHTFDTAHLKALGVIGMEGDPARAAELYRTAARMGVAVEIAAAQAP